MNNKCTEDKIPARITKGDKRERERKLLIADKEIQRETNLLTYLMKLKPELEQRKDGDWH